MRAVILMGSPRKNGNTAALVAPYVRELEAKGVDCTSFDVYDMDLRPCVACRVCQQNWKVFGCCQDDDMGKIFDAVMEADLIAVASPIYSWYCTPPVKNVLDRLVYGMNKYYGEKVGPSLWEGKRLALITTCGYPVEKGTDLFEEGMKRYAKHSGLQYIGMAAERQRNYHEPFMDGDKEAKMIAFANHCYGACEEV